MSRLLTTDAAVPGRADRNHRHLRRSGPFPAGIARAGRRTGPALSGFLSHQAARPGRAAGSPGAYPACGAAGQLRPPVMIILALTAAALAVWAIALYNLLVRDRARVAAAWSDVEVQLKRRHDLIPKLVETVKQHAGYERGVLEHVVRRAAARCPRGSPVAEGAPRASSGATCIGSSPWPRPIRSSRPARASSTCSAISRRPRTDPVRAPLLQRRGQQSQHASGHLSRCSDRARVRFPRRRILRAGQRRRGAAGGGEMMRTILSTLALLLAQLAGADERILSYDSRIEVRSDSSLEVTETILVRAEGSKIRRGIFREFPTTYSRPDGSQGTVGFEVLSVRRNGVDEPYHMERRSNGVAVYIGHKDRFLPPGEYQLRDPLSHRPAAGFLRRPRRAVLERHRSGLGLSDRLAPRRRCRLPAAFPQTQCDWRATPARWGQRAGTTGRSWRTAAPCSRRPSRSAAARD